MVQVQIQGQVQIPGTGTGMESDILVDAFRIATSLHNLRYARFVADCHSSTHSEIIARVPYGRNVEKLSVLIISANASKTDYIRSSTNMPNAEDFLVPQ